MQTPSSVSSLSDLHTTFAIDEASILELQRYSLESADAHSESSEENLPVAYAHAADTYADIYDHVTGTLNTSILSHY
jgi:hypothetical protein